MNSRDSSIAKLDFSEVLCPGGCVTAPAKVKKTKSSKPVLYPIFAECANIMRDVFWSRKFAQASKGKFPAKFTFDGQILTYNKGLKSKSIQVPGDDAFRTANICCQFFRDTAYIVSPSDKKQVQEEPAPQQHITWANANEKTREALLSFFYDDLRSHLTLTSDEVKRLRNTLRLGILNRYFGAKNIIVQMNRIRDVQGFHWDPSRRVFFINPLLQPDDPRPSRKKDTAYEPFRDSMPRFTLLWRKRQEHLQKKKNKSYQSGQRVEYASVTDTVGSGTMLTDESS